MKARQRDTPSPQLRLTKFNTKYKKLNATALPVPQTPARPPRAPPWPGTMGKKRALQRAGHRRLARLLSVTPFPRETALTATAADAKHGAGGRRCPAAPGRRLRRRALCGPRLTPAVRSGEGEKSGGAPTNPSHLRGRPAGRAEEIETANEAGAGFGAPG